MHVLFFSRIVKDFYDLLDTAIRRQVVTAHRDAYRIPLERAREPPYCFWPRCTDCKRRSM